MVEEGSRRRRSGSQEIETITYPGPAGTRPHVEVKREGSGSRKLRRMDRTKKGSPTGVNREVSKIEGGETGAKGRGKMRKKRHTERGCRG